MTVKSTRLENTIKQLAQRWEESEDDLAIEAAIVSLIARGDLNERDAARWLSRLVENPQLASLLRDYAADEWDDDRFKTIYRSYKSAFDASADADGGSGGSRALKTAAMLTERWRDAGDTRNHEKIIVGMIARGELTEKEGARWLSRFVESPQLATLLRDYAGGDWNEERFRELYRCYKGTGLVEDGLATVADASWIDDEPFRTAYEAGKSISVWGHHIHWRVRTLVNCALRASRLPGNFVECGVDRGGTAMSVIKSLASSVFDDRRFFLFDTFQGIVWSQLSDVEKVNARSSDTRYPDVFSFVSETFAPLDFVSLVRGTVPETLENYDAGRVAYLHIDMNASYPECSAFEYFWPLLSPGAPVIFDDYGFTFHVEQRLALDELAARLGTTIMALPTGQGIAWKTGGT